MDLTPFKLDIDELLDEYTKENYTTLADFKRVWMAKKFSYIYEGRPTTNSAVFMQSLFAHCIGHMVSTGTLSRRLGALYCLYCLYEAQPYKPSFKIYLCIGELKRIKDLVVEAKQNEMGVVPALVKRMLDRNMFLFGFVNLLGGSVTQKVKELMKLQNKRVQLAFDKLFANTRIESYVHKDLGVELEVENLKKLSAEYAKAKKSALAEVSQTIDVEDAKHILCDKKTVGEKVEEIIKEWNVQKEEFYKQTGVSPGNELAVVDEFNEIEQLLQE